MKISRIDSWYIGMENPDLFKKFAQPIRMLQKWALHLLMLKFVYNIEPSPDFPRHRALTLS